MTLHALLALLAAAAFVWFALDVAGAGRVRRASWHAPAALAALFLAFSLYAIVAEGPFGFWHDHVLGVWGNQIWFDLLIAVGIAWSFAVPRAKALGMRPLPWLALVLCSGSIGLLAMLARMRHLESGRRAVPGAEDATAGATAS